MSYFSTTIILWEDNEGLHIIEPETDEQREIEIPVEVGFSYTPAEAQTWNYPGCSEDAEIISITEEVKKGETARDLSFLLESDEREEFIENLIEEALKFVQSEKEQAEIDRYEANRED